MRHNHTTFICRLLLIVASLVASLVAPTVSAAVQLKNLRAAMHSDHTRVVIDLSGPAPFRVSENREAGRFELIIPKASMAIKIRQQIFVGTPVRRVHQTTADDELRLVFELADGLEPKAFALEPHLHRGHRIVVDLYDPPATVQPTFPINASKPAVTQATPGARDDVQEIESAHAATQPKRVFERNTVAQQTVRLSATWEHEWAVESGSGETQKFESIVEPRVELDLSNNVRVTAIARIRVDATGDLGPQASSSNNYSDINGPLTNNEHAEFSLRELYLDTRMGNALWRIGKQQVVWGEADGIKVMDVVNPQSFREFVLDDFDDSRIPLWMANVEMMVGDSGSLQLLWIPDNSYHEVAEPDSPFAFSSPLYTPRAPQGLTVRQLKTERPNGLWSDSDAGLRYATFLAGWDLSLNYLYHYQDSPVLYQYLQTGVNGPVGVLAPEYERNHLLGGTLSNVYGPITLRGELVYNSDTFHISRDISSRGIGESAELASVLGLDWQWDAHNTLISAQWFQSHLLDYEQPVIRTETEHTLSLLYQRRFSYDTWKIHALGLYSLDREDRWLNLKWSHMFRDNVELWLGGDFFAGDTDGLYGQFGNRDRVLLGVELGL